MQRLAVYCGSSAGSDPAFAQTAGLVGQVMAERGIDLVYGGGRLGLMGVVADAVLDGGGKVYGVIPAMLKGHEVAHQRLTELHVVETMHERKAKMTELTDAFLALPGGIGTLDELFEAWTWYTLGFHAKPFALLNVDGYWDQLIGFLDTVAAKQFMSEQRREMLIHGDAFEDVLDRLEALADNRPSAITW